MLQWLKGYNEDVILEYRACCHLRKRNLLGRFWILLRLLLHYRVLNRSKLYFSYGNLDQAAAPAFDVECYTAYATEYDVVSFDVFDTLLLRPFNKPTDLFASMEQQLKWPGYASHRITAEKAARELQHNGNLSHEVTLEQIYRQLATELPVTIEEAMKAEISAEKAVCIANTFFVELVGALRHQDKIMICTTDMYLSKKEIGAILSQVGYPAFEEIFVSSQYGCSKYTGELYDVVRNRFPHKKILHIGDNLYSDFIQARLHGFAAIHYVETAKNSK